MTGTGITNITATPNESFEKFGSNGFLGQKFPFFEVDCVGDKIDINALRKYIFRTSWG